ncbi:MAG: DASS family sodium-coupled anion symporter [Bacillota bacterium]
MKLERWRLAVLVLMACLALAFLVGGPRGEGLTPGGRYILSVFILAVGMWVTMPGEYLTPASLVVLVLVVLALACDPATAAKALSTGMSGYGDAGLWLLILGFIYAAAFEKSGLARRIALWLMNLARGSTLGILFSVGIINLVIAPTTPSTIAKGGLLLPIITGLVAAAGVKKGESNFGKAVGIYAGAADNIVSAGILTATISNPLAVSILAKSANLDISWTQWFVYTFPMALLSTLLAFGLIWLLFRPEVTEIPGGQEYLRSEMQALGPVSAHEWKTLASFGLALILWVLDKQILGDAIYKSLPALAQAVVGLHPFIKGVIAALPLFLPGWGVVSWKEAERAVPWGTYVMFGAALGLSAGLTLTKGMDWAVTTVLQRMGVSGLPFLGVFVVLVLLFYYGHMLFFTYTAMAAAMLPVVVSLAKALSFPVLSLYVPAMTLVPYSLIFPFNTVPLLMFSGAGLFETKDSARFGLIFGLVVLAQWVVVGLPFWKALGIIP